MYHSLSLTIVDDSPLPKYLQLADHLKRQIKNRQLTGSTPLPSINHLSARYDLSRDTVRKAYLELKSRDLVEGVRGKGYFVRETDDAAKSQRLLIVLETPGRQSRRIQEQVHESIDAATPVVYRFHYGKVPELESLVSEGLADYRRILIHGSFANATSRSLKSVLGRFPAERTRMICPGTRHRELAVGGVSIDWSEVLFQALSNCRDATQAWKSLHLCFTPSSNLPRLLLPGFQGFCIEGGERGCIVLPSREIHPELNSLYVVLDSWQLIRLLDEVHRMGWQVGREVFILYVGHHPTLESLAGGITELHVDESGPLISCLTSSVSCTGRKWITEGMLTRRASL